MKYFTMDDFVKSSTATKHGITNTPTPEVEQNINTLVDNCLDPLREKMGSPILVNSGYRCEKLNEAIGGSKTSQHCTGQAADIQTPGDALNKKLFELAKTMDFDQLIWEFGNTMKPEWIHISYVSADKNRHQILKSVKLGGKTKYIKM